MDLIPAPFNNNFANGVQVAALPGVANDNIAILGSEALPLVDPPPTENLVIDLLKVTVWFEYNGIYYNSADSIELGVYSYNPVTKAIGDAICTNSTVMASPNNCYQNFNFAAGASSGLTQYQPGLGLVLFMPNGNPTAITGSPVVGPTPHSHLRIWLYYQILPWQTTFFTLNPNFPI